MVRLEFTCISSEKKLKHLLDYKLKISIHCCLKVRQQSQQLEIELRERCLVLIYVPISLQHRVVGA